MPPRLGARLEPLAAELAEVVGAAHVLTDPDVTASHRTDWTGRFGGRRAVVVRPGSAAEVAGVLGACAARGVPVVPQGGNTGLVGGSVPSVDDTVVLSSSRLVDVGPLDASAGQITVGAGVTLTRLAEALVGTGWRYAIDLGARDSATFGGMVATNAGGMRVMRHGPTRQQVAGVEYVTADGAVVTRLGGLLKDNTGYDLAGLLCGSEGTLAVITAVRLRLIPERPEVATAMLGFASRPAAFSAAWSLRRACDDVEVVEYLDRRCVDEVGGAPFAAEAYLLVEAAAATDPTDRLAAAIATIGPDDVAVAGTSAQRDQLWRLRDDLTVTLAARGEVLKYDVSVPSPSLASFCEAVLAAVDADVWLFGHVCDDNVHVNVTGARLEAPAVDDLVLSLVADHGGSISAEHGIGRAKVAHLHLSRSAAEIAQMRALKTALDPDGLLNPGVLLG